MLRKSDIMIRPEQESALSGAVFSKMTTEYILRDRKK